MRRRRLLAWLDCLAALAAGCRHRTATTHEALPPRGDPALGALLERVREQVIREELFAPLGMASCGFGQPAHGAERGQPFGHLLGGEEWAPTDGDVPALLGPSGTVTCTLADWARFVRANMKDPPRSLVGEATLALLQEPVATDRYPDGSPTGPDRIGYAMGWMTFNGNLGPASVVELTPLLRALRAGAELLRASPPPRGAPPAFLLDAARMAGGQTPRPGEFDNRWVTFPQDFPSASYLAEKGILRVLVVQDGDRIADDLTHVLLRYREGGLEVQLLRDSASSPVAAILLTPSRFRSVWYRLLATVGLRRSMGGGFGGVVPAPQTAG
jgi:hypothetical protein